MSKDNQGVGIKMFNGIASSTKLCLWVRVANKIRDMGKLDGYEHNFHRKFQ